MSASSFPVQLRLEGRRCLVVGGGPVAARKVAGLLAAGARVTVVAPDAVDELASSPLVRWHRRPYERGEVASYRLAVTATDDPAVNAQVFRDGEAAGVFVNSADDPENCSYTLPAVARRGDVTVTVSTDGRSPAIAKWMRQQVEQRLGDELDELLDLAEEVLHELRATDGTSEVDGWDAALDGAYALLSAGDRTGALSRLRRGLGLATVSEVAS